jgi:hypothetical protein
VHVQQALTSFDHCISKNAQPAMLAGQLSPISKPRDLTVTYTGRESQSTHVPLSSVYLISLYYDKHSTQGCYFAFTAIFPENSLVLNAMAACTELLQCMLAKAPTHIVSSQSPNYMCLRDGSSKPCCVAACLRSACHRELPQRSGPHQGFVLTQQVH